MYYFSTFFVNLVANVPRRHQKNFKRKKKKNPKQKIRIWRVKAVVCLVTKKFVKFTKYANAELNKRYHTIFVSFLASAVVMPTTFSSIYSVAGSKKTTAGNRNPPKLGHYNQFLQWCNNNPIMCWSGWEVSRLGSPPRGLVEGHRQAPRGHVAAGDGAAEDEAEGGDLEELEAGAVRLQMDELSQAMPT